MLMTSPIHGDELGMRSTWEMKGFADVVQLRVILDYQGDPVSSARSPHRRRTEDQHMEKAM